MPSLETTRRNFLRSAAAATALAGTAFSQQQAQEPNRENEVQLSQIHGPSDEPEHTPGPFLPDSKRIGFAVVGLGRLALDQILPAFGSSKYVKPVALVSGDRDKAQKIAAQYGIKSQNLYDYTTYDRLADNPDVKVTYIVLPNSMHEEFTLRGAKAGKHIFCEKPMTTGSRQAERMIAACHSARVKLMIAYRQQYEPHNIALRKLVTDGKLGQLRSFTASNAQQQGDPSQWRLKLALAGGGCLPDIGLYCLNAARFLSGKEPVEVSATTYQPKEDPRFKEVEAGCNFTLSFPDGYSAICASNYDAHQSQYLRMQGTGGWAELSPAFGYHGNKLSWSHFDGQSNLLINPQIPEKDQFALEMDHFAECILEDKEPRTTGEEGLRDHRIMEAIYTSARTGRPVHLG